MKLITFSLIAYILITLQPSFGQTDKARLIVMADMGHDPDEEQQIIHLLMYSNEFDLEGLIAVTGRYFRPDPPNPVKIPMPELLDLYPSLCDLTGIEKPDHLEGESIVCV